MLNILKKLILVIVSIVLLCLAFIFVYLLYPLYPQSVWLVVHRDKVEKIESLENYFNVEKNYTNNQIKCWEVFNSRCGIIHVFSSPDSTQTIRNKIEKLNYKVKLHNPNDWFSLYTLFDLDLGRNVLLNNAPYDYTKRDYSLAGNSWDWWLEDNSGVNYTISLYELPVKGLNIKIDNEEVNKNLIVILVYIKGR